MTWNPPNNAPIGEMDGVKILAADNLSQVGAFKQARRRREPMLYVVDNAGNNKPGFVNTTKEQNKAAIPLSKAIQMGLIQPEHVSLDEKLEVGEVKIDPAPFETVEKEIPMVQEVNKIAEQKIARAVAFAPVTEPQVQEAVQWEDPNDDMTPEEIINLLSSAIAYERDCGEQLHLVDQAGNKILGIQVVREKPSFVGM